MAMVIDEASPQTAEWRGSGSKLPGGAARALLFASAFAFAATTRASAQTVADVPPDLNRKQ